MNQWFAIRSRFVSECRSLIDIADFDSPDTNCVCYRQSKTKKCHLIMQIRYFLCRMICVLLDPGRVLCWFCFVLVVKKFRYYERCTIIFEKTQCYSKLKFLQKKIGACCRTFRSRSFQKLKIVVFFNKEPTGTIAECIKISYEIPNNIAFILRMPC